MICSIYIICNHHDESQVLFFIYNLKSIFDLPSDAGPDFLYLYNINPTKHEETL